MEKEINVGKMVAVGSYAVGKVEIDDKLGDAAPLAARRYFEEYGKVPYIVITDVSEMWQSSVIYGTSMYKMLDVVISGEYDENDLSAEGVNFILNNMFMTCTLVCDAEYYAQMAVAMKEFIERVQKFVDGAELGAGDMRIDDDMESADSGKGSGDYADGGDNTAEGAGKEV